MLLWLMWRTLEGLLVGAKLERLGSSDTSRPDNATAGVSCCTSADATSARADSRRCTSIAMLCDEAVEACWAVLCWYSRTKWLQWALNDAGL
jgi:hypothetical protein